MGRARVALAAAALVAAAPARAEEWPDYAEPYMRTAVQLLGRLPSTAEPWRFLMRARIDLQVTDNPAHVDDNTVGAYDLVEKRIFIDEVFLLQGAEELSDQGAAAATAARVLAWKTLPTVAHEMTHAMVHERVNRLAGAEVVFPSVEDEELAFYAGCLALFDEFAEKPELWSKERLLGLDKVNADILRAWLKGPGELERWIAAVYEGRPSILDGKPAELVAMVDQRVELIARSVARMRALKRQAAVGGPAMAGLVWREFPDLDQALRYDERQLEVERQTRAALADPATLKRLRDFYAQALAESRRRLEARRPRSP